MAGALYNLVRECRSLSIVGMCKNAGKTTALNSVLRDIPESETPALTSIGWDGESKDVVTGTPKPGIFIRRGSLFATAEGLLRHCDATRELLAATDVGTPLGRVIVARALSDGNVQLAGPSMVTQLVGISRLFREFGADRVIIDGAVGRKTLCSRSLSEATILCTGASCGQSMDAVVAETAHVCRLLMTGEADGVIRAMRLEALSGKYVLFAKEPAFLQDGADIAATIKQAAEPRGLYVEGAVTDNLLDPLVRAGLPEGFTVAARDASRLLLSEGCLRRLLARGGRLAVLEGLHLAAVTVNPYSAYGNHFDPKEFLRCMAAAVPVPVVNVEGGGGGGDD